MIDITENFKRMMDRIERLKQKNHELTRENSRIIALISELSRNISELREANNVLQADLDLVKQCGFELWTTPKYPGPSWPQSDISSRLFKDGEQRRCRR